MTIRETIREEKRFHGWRLIGVIMIVVIGLAVISAVIDWSVIGPLEGRVWEGRA